MGDTYPNGLISWTDLVVPDVDAAKTFYTALMGWHAEDQFAGEQRVYTMFTKGGKNVAGLGQQSDDMQQQDVPPMWTTYVNVDDVDATAAAFTAQGGQLIVAPMDVMDAGRMAYGMDSVGAAVGFWQPGNHKGADQFNEPGFMTWNELTTRQPEEAIAFWEAVLPWKVDAQAMGGGLTYHMVMVGERPTAGIMTMDAEWPADLPSHWMVYFRVQDADSAAARVVELGGSVPVPLFDTPQGKVAVVNDPQGGTFSIIGPAPAQS